MADVSVWRIISLWLYKPWHKYDACATQVSHLKRPFKPPDFKFRQIKDMHVCIYANICISVYSCIYFIYACVYVCAHTHFSIRSSPLVLASWLFASL